MKYRALTISREYGSGGAEIARIVARDLGWKLIDKELIAEISRRENVPARDVESLDEKVDPWIHRMTRSIWGMGADGVTVIAPVDLLDAEKMAALTQQIIEESWAMGNCVIVGRGASCILHDRKDVFHAFIYARWEERLRHVSTRVEPGTDCEALVRAMDAERMKYVQLHFKQNRLDPYLYDLMIDSKDQPERTAQLIISAMQSAGNLGV